MGFPPIRCEAAIAKTGGDMEAAVAWLFENCDQPDEFFLNITAAAAAPAAAMVDDTDEDAGEHTELLKPLLGEVRVPTASDHVHKDECAFTFATPMSDEGINVSLKSFVGVGAEYLQDYSKKTGEHVYVNIKKRKRAVEDSPEKDIANAGNVFEASKQLANGPAYDEELSLVVVDAPGSAPTTIPIVEGTKLPSRIQKAVEQVVQHVEQDAFAALDNFEEDRKISKWADTIVPEPCTRKLSPDPSTWRCDQTGQSISETSLWLNLSDGFVGGGRRNWDGSGGNNTALDHYAEMKAQGKEYPLAVKLGTITPEGADIFSYEASENDMVLVPPEKLAEYLKHWGIDIMSMKKTEKSMQELELDLNMNPNLFSAILEAGVEKVPLYGQGYTGMHNLGNSCYMNSAMQCVFTVPAFKEVFADKANEIFDGVQGNPAEDFRAQLAKVGTGLLSGAYSQDGAAEAMEGIRPKLFKQAVGKGHAEFSSARQQDVTEFLTYLFTKIEREQRAAGAVDPTTVFAFTLEDRQECDQSKQVQYHSRPDNILHLAIPIKAATNAAAVAEWEAKKAATEAKGEKPNMDDAVQAEIPASALFESFGSPSQISDWLSPVTQQKGSLTSKTCFLTFPEFLLVHLRRETVGDDWVPKKLDCKIAMPEELNLEHLRKAQPGLQPGEVAIAEAPAAAAAPQFDEGVVNDLIQMGFPPEACKKAVINTGNCGAEAASEWLMSHMDDPDFAEPMAAPSGGAAAPVDQGSVEMLMSMGFGKSVCEKALRSTGGDVERATDWIFSHPDDDGSEETPAAAAAPAEVVHDNGPANYELVAFISHLGRATTSGHYVAHVKKNGEWAFFNDEKVCKSTSTPFEHGYVYLYRRC